MASAALMGWDPIATQWRKLICNSEGKLIIDPHEILEDTPTDGEVGKGPTSNWAYDHENDASAHHAKYTDAEARAAIGGLFDSGGVLQLNINGNYHVINNLWRLYMRQSAASDNFLILGHGNSNPYLDIYCALAAGGYEPMSIRLYNGTGYDIVATVAVVDTKIATHTANASAHHTRYTDSEARAAIGGLLDSLGVVLKNLDCGYFIVYHVNNLRLQQSAASDNRVDIGTVDSDPTLYIKCTVLAGGTEAMTVKVFNGTIYETLATEPVVDAKIVNLVGTKYWSCNGIHFDATNPDTDDISKSTGGKIVCNADNISFVGSVLLPHGATVTAVKVTGNAGAAAETWSLKRFALSDLAVVTMAGNNINSSDTTIDSAVVDNSLYSYVLITSTLDTGDEIYGAVITYTI